MPNYNNGKIYKIVNNIDNMIYIGSTTCRLCSRMNVHRVFAKNNHNANLYRYMRELGITNFTIVLIENYPCSSKEHLLRRERHVFDLHDKQILLNSNRPHTTCIERLQQIRNWQMDNKEYHTNQKKLWHTNNKNYHNNQIKLWFVKNRLYRKIYMQKYKEHQKIMQELPFYKVPLTTSF